jgi:hypothetical protein
VASVRAWVSARQPPKTVANLFVNFEFITDIERAFEGRSTKLEIRTSSEDLQSYVDEHILKLPSFVSRIADLQSSEWDVCILHAIKISHC